MWDFVFKIIWRSLGVRFPMKVIGNTLQIRMAECLLQIKLYMQSSDFSNLAFATEIPATMRLSKTVRKSRPKPPAPQEVTPYDTLKHLKHKAKLMQQEFIDEKINHQKIRRSLQQVNKQSQIKRAQFLKIYGNKKSMYQHHQLLEKKQKEDLQVERRSMDLVKKRKLQSELHQIMLQNEEEDYVMQLQQINRVNRQAYKKQLELAHVREMETKRHHEIRTANTQFLIRKKNIQTSVSMRAKGNYYSKVNQELTTIRQYEDLIMSIESLEVFPQKPEGQTMANTIEANNKTFLTNNFTISY